MLENLKILFDGLPQQPQCQNSVYDQLRDLSAFANHLGLYDAADFIRVSIGLR